MLIYTKKATQIFGHFTDNQQLLVVKQNPKNMLQHKDRIILSEINYFFTSSEKVMETIFSFIGSLTFLDRKYGFSIIIQKRDVAPLLCLFQSKSIPVFHSESILFNLVTQKYFDFCYKYD